VYVWGMLVLHPFNSLVTYKKLHTMGSGVDVSMLSVCSYISLISFILLFAEHVSSLKSKPDMMNYPW